MCHTLPCIQQRLCLSFLSFTELCISASPFSLLGPDVSSASPVTSLKGLLQPGHTSNSFAPHLLPSLPYRLTCFISLSIIISVFSGLLSATYDNVYAVSILALFLIYLDSFCVYFYFQYHYFLLHTALLFPIPPHISPSQDNYSLSSEVSSLIFINALNFRRLSYEQEKVDVSLTKSKCKKTFYLDHARVNLK